MLHTNDHGGIPEIMKPFRPDGNLYLHFSLKAYKSEEQGKWLAPRSQSLLAFNSQEYNLHKTYTNTINQEAKRNVLVSRLLELKVSQISFTRLKSLTNYNNMPSIRVRLDWTDPRDNFLLKREKNSLLEEVASKICNLLF